ncbi:hypothetical protein [Aliivibrio fischeri]|uniref:hypothetical protein n=1 Tax=Aliivibrio fischeri TaxID=668 RepID=UPI0009080EE6|nr:hypothetical protein [Aliivibrio fischeri]
MVDLSFTDYLAIYGAVLSTIIFTWNVIKSRPTFCVDFIPGFNDENTLEGEFIIIRNKSAHKIYLAGVELLYPTERGTKVEFLRLCIKHKQYFKSFGWCSVNLNQIQVNDECPLVLESGQSHRIFIPRKIVNNLIEEGSEKKLMASAQDQLFNNRYSKVRTFN